MNELTHNLYIRKPETLSFANEVWLFAFYFFGFVMVIRLMKWRAIIMGVWRKFINGYFLINIIYFKIVGKRLKNNILRYLLTRSYILYKIRLGVNILIET